MKGASLRGQVAIWATILLFAILFGFLIYRNASNSEALYQHQASQNAQAYRDTARKHAEVTCGGLPAAEIRKCVHEEYHAARERERNERDLEAQLVTSAWTRGMGLAAIIAMVVGIAGVGLVYFTFQETRRTADEARRNVEAFMDAERARIHVVTPEFSDLEDGEIPQLHLELKLANFGRSPCKVTKVEWAVLEDIVWHHDFLEVGYSGRDLNVVIPPDTQPHKVADLQIPFGKPYVGGHVIYDTQFKSDCRTHFLWGGIDQLYKGGAQRDWTHVWTQNRVNWPKDS